MGGSSSKSSGKKGSISSPVSKGPSGYGQRGSEAAPSMTIPVLVQPVLAGNGPSSSGAAVGTSAATTGASGPQGGARQVATPYADTREHEVRSVGLDNFGNTCYCNSVVQLLYHCSALRTRLLALYDEHFTKKPANDTILYRLSDLVHQMHMAKRNMRKDDSSCSKMQSFVKRYKALNEVFDNRQQHDAHEFAIYILSTIIEDEKTLLNLPKNKRGPIQEIFEGQLRTSTYCLDCETKADRKQPFLDLNLQIQPHASLVNSFQSFMAPEFFSADNKFFCEACCAHVNAKQMNGMDKAPRDAMLVHLKRFEFSDRDQLMKKLSYHVPLPDDVGIETTITRVTQGSCADGKGATELSVFRLKGFVVHQGAGVHVGHYVGCFRTGDQWRRYDDELVTNVAERDLQQYYGEPKIDDSMLTVAMTAYILLYERQR